MGNLDYTLPELRKAAEKAVSELLKKIQNIISIKSLKNGVVNTSASENVLI